MSNYKLINPSLQGNLKNVVSARQPLDAAKQIWTNLSKYITNDVPAFAFTIENQNGGEMHHFKVQETQNKGEAEFKIEEINIKLKDADMKKFKQRAEKSGKSVMKGGEKDKKDKKDDSSSSSSSEAFDALKMYKKFNRTVQPITYWWYDPYVYGMSSVYIPTFVTPVLPYIEIATVAYYTY
jgi:hypothetical protein